MTKYLLIMLGAIALGSCGNNFHPRDKEEPEWGQIFKSYGIDSAGMEVLDNSHERVQYYNLARISQRRPPASTFKIFLALVALETGIAPDESLVIPWDGKHYSISGWDHDMDMVEAMKLSSEPYFREIAKRIGKETLQMYLDTTRYGNMRIGDDVQNCWHDGSLLISPDEQVGFLLALYHDRLNFSARTQRIVRNLLPTEDSLARYPKGYRMTYKTGTSLLGDTAYNCWLVGYMEDSVNNAHPYFFANNFDLPSKYSLDSMINLRLEVTRKIFANMGLL